VTWCLLLSKHNRTGVPVRMIMMLAREGRSWSLDWPWGGPKTVETQPRLGIREPGSWQTWAGRVR
jgi:hypothetical protein